MKKKLTMYFLFLQESDFGGGDNADAAGEDSDFASNQKSRKSSSRKSSSHNTSSSVQSQEPATGMPTIEEVCSTFGLTDVQINYSDADFQNLTTYKLFQQHVRPLLAKENPKVPMSKLMMLVAAKWRDFSEMNPHTQPDAEVSSANMDEESKTSRSSRGAAVQEAEDDEEDEEDSEFFKRKSRGSRAKKGKKASKVPTLKIKLGKRKRGSSVSILLIVKKQKLNQNIFYFSLLIFFSYNFIYRTRKWKEQVPARIEIQTWSSSKCWQMQKNHQLKEAPKVPKRQAPSNRQSLQYAERQKQKLATKPRRKRRRRQRRNFQMERKVSR